MKESRMIVDPPTKIPLYIKLATWFAERKTKKEMSLPQILAWYPKAAISSGVLESLIAHNDKEISDRLLKLIRIQTATLVGCSFCIDMNRSDHEKENITLEELNMIEQCDNPINVKSLSEREVNALLFTRMLTSTPVTVDSQLIEKIHLLFSEREIVIMNTTIAQVNYWSRLIKGFGIPIACSIQ